MKYAKLGLISVVFLGVLVLIISMLMPSSITVSRAVDINASPDSVHSMVNDLPKWKFWIMNYDSSKASVKANSKGENAQLKMNNTTVTIIESSQRTIKTMWQVGKSNPLPASFDFIRHQSSSVTTVHWQFDQKVRWYPWEKFAAIFSEKALGPFMDSSLATLKQVAENQK